YRRAVAAKSTHSLKPATHQLTRDTPSTEKNGAPWQAGYPMVASTKPTHLHCSTVTVLSIRYMLEIVQNSRHGHQICRTVPRFRWCRRDCSAAASSVILARGSHGMCRSAVGPSTFGTRQAPAAECTSRPVFGGGVASLDIFWLKDESLEDAAGLGEP